MKPPAVKRLLLPAILLAGLTLFFASGANEIISWGFLGTHYAAIKSFAGDHIWLGYLAFFCCYVLAVAFSLPIASLLTLAGGAVLGWPAVILGRHRSNNRRRIGVSGSAQSIYRSIAPTRRSVFYQA
jgi:hypothetical protein